MVRIGIKPGTIVREQETAPRRTFPIATSLHWIGTIGKDMVFEESKVPDRRW